MTKYLIAILISVGASLTLAGVASADPVSDLAKANDISNPNLILTGQVLHVEGQPDYVVRKGDTLTLITRQLGTSPAPAVDVSAVAPTGGGTQPPPVPDAPPVVTPPPAVSVHPVNWDAVARCESGGNWAINTGNGFHGGLQFTLGTWHSNGGSGSPESASKEEQMRVADNVLKTQGIGAWPVCGRRA